MKTRLASVMKRAAILRRSPYIELVGAVRVFAIFGAIEVAFFDGHWWGAWPMSLYWIAGCIVGALAVPDRMRRLACAWRGRHKTAAGVIGPSQCQTCGKALLVLGEAVPGSVVEWEFMLPDGSGSFRFGLGPPPDEDQPPAHTVH